VTFSIILLIITINKTLLSGTSSRFWPQLHFDNDKHLDVQAELLEVEESIKSPLHNCSLPTRYDIYTGVAACYPSSGGIWLARLGPLELQHLNIDRFQSSERPWNEADENDFCHELRQFGGSWYNPQSTDELWSGDECRELVELEPIFSNTRRTGFTEKGGAWVLGVSGEDESFPQGTRVVRNALTMEERCMALERLGAVFCEDIKSCPALDDLSKEPFELAEEMGLIGEYDDPSDALA